MVDKAKRSTLKSVAGLGLGGIAAATSTGALAGLTATPSGKVNGAATPSEIHVYTRLSAKTNNLEVVIRNVGQHDATLSTMTPAEINTMRGKFDFAALFKDGSVHLKAGENVIVPMQRNTVVLDGRPLKTRAYNLQAAIKRDISVTVDGGAVANVSLGELYNYA